VTEPEHRPAPDDFYLQTRWNIFEGRRHRHYSVTAEVECKGVRLTVQSDGRSCGAWLNLRRARAIRAAFDAAIETVEHNGRLADESGSCAQSADD
jgi:hypothetical protein